MSIPQEQLSQLKDLLKIHYGFDSFRFGQEQAIKNILEGKDNVIIMPTGGGKSLIYQLPSLIMEGVTIVISPLIALMKDQVDQLDQMGIPATFINSSISPIETQNRIEAIRNNTYKLIYIAPERFYSQQFIDLIQNIKISLFAIDEAHCISEWGHDFRPSYMRLRDIIKLLNNPTVAALTATATPEVRADIVKQLELEKPEIIVTGFDRPNLKFGVTHASDTQKYDQITNVVQQIDGSGIIYAGTRQKVETILENLLANGVKAIGYHAGMLSEDRKFIQNEFMKGNARVIIATNAFGLGINKPDIRFVVHFDMPGTIEAYYQEAGRAGRDSQESYCILFYSPADRYLREFFIKGDNPPPKVITEIYRALLDYGDDTILVTYSDLTDCLSENVPDMAIGTAIKILEKEKYLERRNEKQGLAFLKLLHEISAIKVSLSSRAKTQHQVFDALVQKFGKQLMEGVEFSPEEIADLAKVKRDAVTRLIKKLSDEGAIEYKPPFRGTELKLLKRVRPEELDINFSALKEKHKRETNKLDLMESYVYHHGCRRKYLLDYFSDKTANKCNVCDNCRTGLTEAGTENEASPIQDISGEIKLETKLTQLETYELYEQGLSIDEIAQTRNLKPGTIIQHLIFLIAKNKEININKFVDHKKQKLIKQAAKKFGTDTLTPIKEKLGDDVSWDDIRLVIAGLK